MDRSQALHAIIEDRQLRRGTATEGLVDHFWGACTQICRKIMNLGEPCSVHRMLDEELTDEFGDDLESAVLYVSGERQNAGEPFQDIDPEIRAWLRNGGYPLNAFADVLWHFDRYDWHGVAGASAWFSDALTRWAQHVAEQAAGSGPTLRRIFVARAGPYARRGESPVEREH